MIRLFRILTAVVLMAHLLLGCCVHHAHACDDMRHSPPIRGSAFFETHCSEDCDKDTDHSNPGSQRCQGEKCSFVRPSPVANDSPTQPLSVFIVPLIEGTISPKGIGSEQRFSASGRIPMPLRLHLLNQVLLI